MTDIEKIDRMMEITGESYETIRAALLEANGDMDQAILAILRSKEGAATEAPDVEYEEVKEDEKPAKGALASDIIDTIKEIWEKGNASSLIIEKGGKEIMNLSLTIGTIGLVIAPVAAVIGLGAALITEYQIKIVMDDGKVINVNELASGKK